MSDESTESALEGGLVFLKFLILFDVDVNTKIKIQLEVLDDFIELEVQVTLQFRLQLATHMKLPRLSMVMSI